MSKPESAPEELFLNRRSALWGDPETRDLDAFLVNAPVNIRYLCGFSGSTALLLLTGERALFFTDGRYSEQSAAEVRGAEVGIVQGPLRNVLKDHIEPRARVGFDAGRLTVAEARLLEVACPGVLWKPVEGVIERLRLVKDAFEINALRNAADIACEVLEEVAALLAPGLTELEIAGKLEESLRRHGSEGSAFEPIVVSGVNGSMPHGRATGKVIEAGDCVTIDFGAVWNGYHSDITRTFALPPVDEECRQWQAVLERAIETALEASEPGCSCKELDAVARGVIDEVGLGEYFVHNLGHGLGLEVHEGPHLSRNSAESLVEGMVFTIEPGIYVPDRGGVRIEEDVLMTGEGPDILTRFPRSLGISGG